MKKIDEITRNLKEDWARHVLQKTEPNPPKKLLPFRKFIGKSRRQKIKLGEATYYLSGFDRDQPGELRIGFVKLDAQMDADARIEALSEFANNLVDLPSEVVCVAIWKEVESTSQ